MLLVLEGVHTRPETVVGIPDQLLLSDQSFERLENELFLLTDVVENLLLENEVAAVDSDAAVIDGMNSVDQIAVALLYGDRVVAQIGTDAEKAGKLVLLVEVLNLFGQVQVRKTVAIVRQELVFPLDVLLHGFQAHADV